jgi:CheY-like chemotaxis protein
MTARALDGDRERCIDAGMDDLVSKPMRRQQLTDVLRRWISSHTLVHAQRSVAPAAETAAPRRRSA